MGKYILALDEGTTSARAIIFDKSGKNISVAQHEFTQIYPSAGWVEHDPEEIFGKLYASMRESIEKSGIKPEEIAGIGITNQRETTVVWDKNTGKPIYNAIVWQCRRTAEICEKLKKDGYSEYIAKTTGLKIDAYFSGTKIKWILDNVKGAREKAEKGELLFGTIDTWIVWKLTGGKAHVTDRTNASRTMIFDINNGCWDDKLLSVLGIPKSMLPEVKSSSEIYGYAEYDGVKIPICGIAGDQQASLFGQGCFEKGSVKNTYGTGCFLLANVGHERAESKNGLITTLGATLKGEKSEYVLEGSVFVGGAVIQWLRDEMKLIDTAPESEYFASKVEDNGGVYIVPAFAGLGAPYWDMDVRGAIFGLTRGANKNHIIRAALEAIAYQTDDLIKAMEADVGYKMKELKVDGGATANELLMQFQADISDIEVLRAKASESTALGAAFLAGLAVGFYKDRNEIKTLVSSGKTYRPEMSDKTRNKLISGWKKAVNASRSF